MLAMLTGCQQACNFDTSLFLIQELELPVLHLDNVAEYVSHTWLLGSDIVVGSSLQVSRSVERDCMLLQNDGSIICGLDSV